MGAGYADRARTAPLLSYLLCLKGSTPDLRSCLPQKSPILTPEEMEQRRAEAQEKLEKELAEAQAARAAAAAAAAEAERAAVAAEPKTEMERIREKKRLETISKAQLALLVRWRTRWGAWGEAAAAACLQLPAAVACTGCRLVHTGRPLSCPIPPLAPRAHFPIPQEDKEEVRLMNQMVLHSKCMAARDEQRSEKVAAKGAAAAEEARIVAQMEARRKAGLAELEVRAAVKGEGA